MCIGCLTEQAPATEFTFKQPANNTLLQLQPNVSKVARRKQRTTLPKQSPHLVCGGIVQQFRLLEAAQQQRVQMGGYPAVARRCSVCRAQ